MLCHISYRDGFFLFLLEKLTTRNDICSLSNFFCFFKMISTKGSSVFSLVCLPAGLTQAILVVIRVWRPSSPLIKISIATVNTECSLLFMYQCLLHCLLCSLISISSTVTSACNHWLHQTSLQLLKPNGAITAKEMLIYAMH